MSEKHNYPFGSKPMRSAVKVGPSRAIAYGTGPDRLTGRVLSPNSRPPNMRDRTASLDPEAKRDHAPEKRARIRDVENRK
jgi:hypothetical protein